MDAARLIIFVKAPRPGAVKTRLIALLGAEGACRAYRDLVEKLLEKLALLAPVELRFTPDDAQSEIRPWMCPGWSSAPQGKGDLGKRLRHAFAEAFHSGARRVAIIGSDCPAIAPADIQAAWQALADHDAVIGPAVDGGYWLIALRRPCPQLFEHIDWSTERVLQQTLKQAQAAGLRVKMLDSRPDVDTEADWKKFLDDQRDGTG